MRNCGFMRGCVIFSIFVLVLSLLATVCGPSYADTIDTLKKRKVIFLGVRADQPPFSQIGADGVPTGYAVSLCGEIVQSLRDRHNIPDLGVKYVQVSPESHFDDLAAGRVDLLCEGTSMTTQRMEKFEFTLQTWISGVSLMTRSELAIGNIRDLAGHRVGVVGGTATEVLVRASLQHALVTAEVVTFATDSSATKALLDKKIDAYFGDRDTLGIIRRQSKQASRLKIAEQDLSLEPYAMAIRRGDDRLRLTANLTLARLYRTGKIQDILHSYFPGAEPSPLLKAMFILESIPEL